MKICAIICEYNPLHNGHLYQLRKAKALSNADAILCIMSGNFLQRGEAAVADKYVRAKHAVLAGADIVIELPVAFATANAELFAKGAVHILAAVPSVTHLCFGAENADTELFIRAAKLLNDEPKSVSENIQKSVQTGMSYAKARAQTFAEYLPQGFLTSPNNVLGVEYTRTLFVERSRIQILPIARIGGEYKNETLQTEYSSASAIRAALRDNRPVTGQLPPYVVSDVDYRTQTDLEKIEKYAILSKSASDIAKVCDCTEGLENAFKRAAQDNAPLIDTLTSARYTSSRIRRIALQNALHIEETCIREGLRSPLYMRVLAANKERKDVLSALSESVAPLILRAHDECALDKAARNCFEADNRADELYRILFDLPKSEKTIFI